MSSSPTSRRPARLGPGSDQPVHRRRGDPARPESGPADPVRGGRGSRGPGAAGGTGSALRPVAAVPRVQAGGRLSGRLADPAQGRRFPRDVGLEPRFARLAARADDRRSAPSRFAALAAKALAPKQAERLSLAHLHAPAVSVREQAAVVVDRLRRPADHDLSCADRRLRPTC